MLRKIIIKNFQSHKKTVVKLTEGSNIIVGKTDSGKSAIVKAVFWVCFNRPLGDDYVSWWEHDGTCVSLHFDNGTVKRVKSKKDNAYYLIIDGKEQRYMADRSVPEPISDFLKMESMNFHMQRERTFMLDWTPAERGQFINKITNLESIDTAISNIKRRVSTESKQLDNLIDIKKELKKEIMELPDLSSFEKQLNEIEINEKEIRKYERQIVELSKLIESLTDIDESLSEVQCFDHLIKEIDDTLSGVDKYRKINKKYNEIKKLLSRIDKIDINIKTKSKKIKSLQKQFDKLMPTNKCPLCER